MARTQDAILSEILDSLCARFLFNCPKEELSSVERMLFLVEQMHWFYDDFYRDNDTSLPRLSFHSFARLVFTRFPPLREHLHEVDAAVDRFRAYKVQVPVCGGIILNTQLTKCVLVRGFHAKAAWMFPRGKINKGEDYMACAVREVLEETGFDATNFVDSKDFIKFTNQKQPVRLYIMPGVPEDTKFEPRTRKEIGGIQWHSISALMKSRQDSSRLRTYHVFPCFNQLLAWIKKNSNNRDRLTRGARADAMQRLSENLSFSALRSSGGEVADGQGSEARHVDPIQKLLRDNPHLHVYQANGVENNPMLQLYQQSQLLPQRTMDTHYPLPPAFGTPALPSTAQPVSSLPSEQLVREEDEDSSSTAPYQTHRSEPTSEPSSVAVTHFPIPLSLKVTNKLTTVRKCSLDFLRVPQGETRPRNAMQSFSFDTNRIEAAAGQHLPPNS
eukprot:CAMPEP_0119137350 /NCGR_PEP_ID=MMETSP1310-20130426/23431_1 /TAXON_ID=464262 /ORGANISM="Genus nov. species nov., Strain RCC2339" /LENGTH=442 /DNA_ID=CAMNT_0007128431 /DNA_START=58 /DNA_END=1386 /DNA_ORIENTATION=+